MDENMNNDFNYFIENYMDFYKKYGHKFIAIKNKKVWIAQLLSHWSQEA